HRRHVAPLRRDGGTVRPELANAETSGPVLPGCHDRKGRLDTLRLLQDEVGSVRPVDEGPRNRGPSSVPGRRIRPPRARTLREATRIVTATAFTLSATGASNPTAHRHDTGRGFVLLPSGIAKACHSS